MLRRILVLASVLLLAGNAVAIPYPIFVLGGMKGKIIRRDYSVSDLAGSWAEVFSNPPHRQLNPEHKVSKFKGIEIRRLLAGFEIDNRNFIYATGSDGYISMIPTRLIKDYRTILAFQQNGEALTRNGGEQQIVFPTEGTSSQGIPRPFAQKAAFWCWYVRSLVVSDLPNTLMIEKNKLEGRMLAKKGKIIHYGFPSVFSYEKIECPPAVSIPLASVLKSPNVQLKTLSGQSLEITADLANNPQLILATGKNALSVACGGPFVVLKKGKAIPLDGRYQPDDLVYSVYALQTSR